MDSKLIWLGAGAFGGWLLSQVGSLISDMVRRWLLKRSIVAELQQLYEETERVWLVCARSLQVHALGGIDNHMPLPISDKVFANHYADASIVFTRVQRTAMELIHTYVAEVNKRIDQTEERISAFHDAKAEGRPLESYAERYESALVSLMRTSAQTRWMARYYQQRPDFPVLENTSSEADSYRIYLDNVAAELENIKASVKGLTVEDFQNAVPRPRPSPPVT